MGPQKAPDGHKYFDTVRLYKRPLIPLVECAKYQKPFLCISLLVSLKDLVY